MKHNFTIGVKSIKRLKELENKNIDSIYCGYVDKYSVSKWPEAFNIVNKRGEGTSIVGKREFKKFVNVAKECNIHNIFVAFNSFYCKSQYKWILEAIEFVSKFDSVKGIIIADINLLIKLKSIGYKKEIRMSTVAGNFNSSTISFYKSLGASSFVLDKQLKCNEIISILNNHKDTIFEIFILFTKCPLIEAYCSFLHTNEFNNKKQRYRVTKEPASCVILKKMLVNNDFKIEKKNSTDNNITSVNNKKLKDKIAGCNLCNMKILSKYDNVRYKISRSTPRAFFEKIDNSLKQISNINEYSEKDMFVDFFGYDCTEYDCIARNKIVQE